MSNILNASEAKIVNSTFPQIARGYIDQMKYEGSSRFSLCIVKLISTSRIYLMVHKDCFLSGGDSSYLTNFE